MEMQIQLQALEVKQGRECRGKISYTFTILYDTTSVCQILLTISNWLTHFSNTAEKNWNYGRIKVWKHNHIFFLESDINLIFHSFSKYFRSLYLLSVSLFSIYVIYFNKSPTLFYFGHHCCKAQQPVIATACLYLMPADSEGHSTNITLLDLNIVKKEG